MNEIPPIKATPISNFPKPETLLLEIPIYKEYELSDVSYEEIKNLESFKESIDAYCIDCKRQSVFWSQQVNQFREPNEGVLMKERLTSIRKKTEVFILC